MCNLCAFYFFYNLYFLNSQFSFNLLYVISDRPDILYAFLLRFSDSISRKKNGEGQRCVYGIRLVERLLFHNTNLKDNAVRSAEPDLGG